MKYKILKILVVFILVTCFADARIEKVFARATKYHKTDKNCDTDTKKGLTSTKIKLKDSCEKTIGMVAVDYNIVPYGSLVYSPDTDRFFIACDIGSAVFNRTAAKKLAKKKGLGLKYQEAIVLDFYGDREILDNHFGNFYVIKHKGSDFHKLYKTSQDKRLCPKFWLKQVETMKINNSLRKIKQALKDVTVS
jgi:3D (Asp-Asp-Asp) domain-containing protein